MAPHPTPPPAAPGRAASSGLGGHRAPTVLAEDGPAPRHQGRDPALAVSPPGSGPLLGDPHAHRGHEESRLPGGGDVPRPVGWLSLRDQLHRRAEDSPRDTAAAPRPE